MGGIASRPWVWYAPRGRGLHGRPGKPGKARRTNYPHRRLSDLIEQPFAFARVDALDSASGSYVIWSANSPLTGS